jgi:hypothetical protein
VSPDRSGYDDEKENTTPPTRSYVDALLKGNISEDELKSLKSEIGGAPRGAAADDEDEARTRFHAYTPEERLSARPDADDDEDEARTRFHSYTPEERQSARPDADEDEARTRSHSYTPQERVAPHSWDDDPDEAATRFHSYTPAERLSARPEAEPDEDEARTIFRPSRAPAARPVTGPPASAGPASGPPTTGRPPAARLQSGPPPSVRARARGALGGGPASAPVVPSSERPLVDFGDILAEDIPSPPTDSSPSIPSLRSYERRALDETFLEALGGADSVPRLAWSPDQLKSLPLGAGEGFLLSRVDGESSVDDLIDISGLPRLDTLRILYQLLQQGVVAVGRR